MLGYRFHAPHNEAWKNKEECLMADDRVNDRNGSGEMPERNSRLMEDTEFWRLNVKALEDGRFDCI